MEQARISTFRPRLAIAQGVFDVLTGVWPLVHMRSFTAVTGPKREHWLVKTAGVLIAAIGGALTAAGKRRRVTPEVAFLAAGSAFGLAAIDMVYVAKRRISPVYLADAIVELGLVVAWAAAPRSAPMVQPE
jgi:hypothetical protein